MVAKIQGLFLPLMEVFVNMQKDEETEGKNKEIKN